MRAAGGKPPRAVRERRPPLHADKAPQRGEADLRRPEFLCPGTWVSRKAAWSPSTPAGFRALWEERPRERTFASIGGRSVAQPRLQRTHGAHYSFSGQTTSARPWTPLLLEMKEKISKAASCDFNMCLVNYYCDGTQYAGAHRDDTRQMVEGTPVATQSWGESR
jgi:alkylated DNA repair dioxygenase AlkB